ncbi:MAG: hypothetical protein ACK4LQ_06115 [Pararhodobacter sp.]
MLLTSVVPGQRGAESVELLDGLSAGTAVVLFPPNTLTDGARIMVR